MLDEKPGFANKLCYCVGAVTSINKECRNGGESLHSGFNFHKKIKAIREF